jgi:3-carboxy-cis,cis-muconate cycloisomerase
VRPSSSSSDDVFSGVLSKGGVAAHVGGRAWLQALLEFEAALARAQAHAGVITAEQANEIQTVCELDRFDVATVGAAAAEIGNPAGAVVKRLRAMTDAPVHHGATSQDALDTAAMLVTKRALGPLRHDLHAAADAAAHLAHDHRDTPIMGRTLLQAARPTTFGLKAAGWMLGLDEAADDVGRVPLCVQLGGPVGTLADAGGPEVVVRLARDLGLEAPVIPWHTRRGHVGELAGALGVAAGAVAKPARDVTLLSQTEVGEVREARGGGSSSMPHKHNPVAAVSALGCAQQAPGYVATLLAAMTQEHERAAGAWHSEWRPLTDLLVTVGSAAAWLRESLTGLEVDPQRMRANLGDDFDVGAAPELVDKALSHR